MTNTQMCVLSTVTYYSENDMPLIIPITVTEPESSWIGKQ